jgi:hypothetical protein
MKIFHGRLGNLRWWSLGGRAWSLFTVWHDEREPWWRVLVTGFRRSFEMRRD